MIDLTINGQRVSVAEGTTVAAALMNIDVAAFRRSTTGSNRGPLCGMGICLECRVNINGESHQRGCTILAKEGMEIVTDE